MIALALPVRVSGWTIGIIGDVKAENNIIRSFFLKYNLENTVDKGNDSSEGNVNLKKERNCN